MELEFLFSPCSQSSLLTSKVWFTLITWSSFWDRYLIFWYMWKVPSVDGNTLCALCDSRNTEHHSFVFLYSEKSYISQWEAACCFSVSSDKKCPHTSLQDFLLWPTLVVFSFLNSPKQATTPLCERCLISERYWGQHSWISVVKWGLERLHS